MSFLDLDEWLFELAKHVEIIYSPIVDVKAYPEEVDVCLVEGAVSTDEQVEMAKRIRERTKIVVAFGDCAVTSNVPSMRNPLGKPEVVLQRAYDSPEFLHHQIPNEPGILPVLTERARPLHEVIDVDIYLPGCPPPAKRIQEMLQRLLAGGPVQLEGRELIKFG